MWSPTPRSSLAAAARPPQQFIERLVVKDGTKVTLIPVGKLDYAEAQDDYVALATQGKKHLKQQTIAGLEACLNPADFVRIHRSYIVNLERVKEMRPHQNVEFFLVLDSGHEIKLSRSYRDKVKLLT